MCKKPITLINPHYKKLADMLGHSVYHYSAAEDFRLRVPCGHCDECLSRRSQQWFLRADHIMKSLGLRPDQCYFCTFTLKPEVYEEAKAAPYLPIRRFLDRLRKHPRFRYRDPDTKRYRYRKVKFPYLFVVEFADGSRAAERGLPSTHRMHYHAILFNPPLYWWQIRDLWSCNGISQVEPLKSAAGVRYVLKYLTKDCKEFQTMTDVDRSKNGKLVVSHGFGRLSKDDRRIMRDNMMRSGKSWFCVMVGNFPYSIPKYWRDACFTKLERRCRNQSLIPPLLWKRVLKDYPASKGYTEYQRLCIYHVLLWP